MLLCASALRAQTTPPAAGPAGVFDTDEAWLASGVAVGTALLHLADRPLMMRAQDSTIAERRVLTPIATRLNFVGRPGSFFLAGGALITGEAVRSTDLSDLGLHTLGALVATELATRAIKGAVGRARPAVTADASEFHPGRGFRHKEWASFPSGHTASSFATAAVVQGELARWHSRMQIPAAVLLYGTASAVGLARIYDNRHWATDVLVGAALGFMIGEGTVSWPTAAGRTSRSAVRCWRRRAPRAPRSSR